MSKQTKEGKESRKPKRGTNLFNNHHENTINENSLDKNMTLDEAMYDRQMNDFNNTHQSKSKHNEKFLNNRKTFLLFIGSNEEPFFVFTEQTLNNLKNNFEEMEFKFKHEDFYNKNHFTKLPLKTNFLQTSNSFQKNFVLFFFGNHKDFDKFFLFWRKKNKIYDLNHQNKKINYVLDIDEAYKPALVFSALCTIKNYLKDRIKIIDHFGPMSATNLKSICKSKLAFENMLLIFSRMNCPFSNELILNLVEEIKDDFYLNLNLSPEDKKNIFEKVVKHFESKLYLQNISNQIINFVVGILLMNENGSGQRLLDLLKVLLPLANEKKIEFFFKNLNSNNWSFSGISFAKMKTFFLNLLKKLFFDKYASKKIKNSRFSEFIQTIILCCEFKHISNEEFNFVIDLCIRLGKKLNENDFKKLAKFYFFENDHQQLNIIIKNLLNNDTKKIIKFILQIIKFYESLEIQFDLDINKFHENRKSFQRSIIQKFKSNTKFRLEITKLDNQDFEFVHKYLFELFLEKINSFKNIFCRLESTNALKTQKKRTYTHFYSSNLGNNNTLKKDLEIILKNQELNNIFTFELKKNEITTLIHFIKESLKNKNILNNFVLFFSISKIKLNRGKMPIIYFICEQILDQIENVILICLDKVSVLQWFEKLLDLVEFLKEEKSILLKIRRIIVSNIEKNYNFIDVYPFIQNLISKRKKSKGFFDNFFKSENFFEEILNKIVIDQNNIQIESQNFWQKLIKIQKESNFFFELFKRALHKLEKSINFNSTENIIKKLNHKKTDFNSWDLEFIFKLFEKLHLLNIQNCHIFSNEFKIDKIFKLIGLCTNQKIINIMSFIVKCIEKDKSIFNSLNDLLNLIQNKKPVLFIKEFIEKLNNKNFFYFERQLGKFLLNNFDFRTLVQIELKNFQIENDIRDSLQAIDKYKKNVFVSKILKPEIEIKINEFYQALKNNSLDEITIHKNINMLREQRLNIENLNNPIYRNGLLFILAENNYFKCLEQLESNKQKIENLRSLIKNPENEEYEENQIGFEKFVKCLRQSEDFIQKLEKIDSSIQKKNLIRYENISFQKTCFLFQDNKLNSPFFKNLREKVFCLKFQKYFFEYAFSFSNLIDFKDQNEIREMMQNFDFQREDRKNDDLIELIKHLDKVPYSFYQSSTKYKQLYNFFEFIAGLRKGNI